MRGSKSWVGASPYYCRDLGSWSELPLGPSNRDCNVEYALCIQCLARQGNRLYAWPWRSMSSVSIRNPCYSLRNSQFHPSPFTHESLHSSAPPPQTKQRESTILIDFLIPSRKTRFGYPGLHLVRLEHLTVYDPRKGKNGVRAYAPPSS
jgi:hypothetical protein